MRSVPDDDALLLALLNTTPADGGVVTDELRDDDLAAAWTTQHGGAGTPGEVTTVRRVREVLQTVVRGEGDPRTLAPFVGGATKVPSMDSGVLVWLLHAPEDDLLAARAVIAWSELERTRPGRLRSCGNPECRLFLIDRSHGNRAQWCSMAVCGNRMKARRHYHRTREASDDVAADPG
ncbi:CGNR zinc finger domain-containing protein [Sanguibacter sp. 25GB23B1]|uniref:CGNR zinc finger domain-containing protein n=1 Tax=unclassified Sanguibacter TaxID=2645534 RepID=UPI0032AEF909